MTVLITADELATALSSDRVPVLLDVRWALGDPNGYAHYRNGHVPGARYVDLDRELAAPPSSTAGRHPLPDLAAFEATARGWGLRSGVAVVVYDDSAGIAASRCWWLLRWAGVVDVRLLDGGLAAWTAAGHPLSTETPRPAQPGDVVLTPGHLDVLTADLAGDLAQAGRLLDARAPERFRGEAEPIDPVAGHIPGAVNAPTTANVDDRGGFLPAGRLRARFAELGITDEATVGAYCGSGVTASHTVVALTIAGLPAALYPGSWSAWISDPSRPIATGG